MKKLLFLLALGAASPALSQDAAPVPIAPVAAAPFRWQLRLNAGQKWRTTTDTLTRTTQQLPPMGGAGATGAALSMKTVARNRVVTEQTVISSDEKGARI